MEFIGIGIRIEIIEMRTEMIGIWIIGIGIGIIGIRIFGIGIFGIGLGINIICSKI